MSTNMKKKTGNLLRVENNAEGRWCSGTAVSVAYHSECQFVVLGIQHAMSMSPIIIYGLPRSTVFFHMIS
jgi:hypothetical protein